MNFKRNILQIPLTIAICASILNAAPEKTIAKSSSSTNILDSLINLDIDSFLGQLLALNIPGLGNIKLSCKLMDGDGLLGDMKDFNFCSLIDKTGGFKYPTFPSFKIDFGGCNLGINLGEAIDMSSCRTSMMEDLCGNIKNKIFDIDIDEYNAGIASHLPDAEIMLSTIGGTEVFGKDTCSDSEKRTKVFEKKSFKDVYGEDGYVSKILEDKEIGGDPVFFNSREASGALRCFRVAIETDQDMEKCYLNNPTPAPDKPDYEIDDSIKKEAVQDIVSEDTKADGGYTGKVEQYWRLFAEKSKKYGIKDWKILMAISMQESELIPSAVGPANKNGSRDYGMMQINSSWSSEIEERYGAQGGFPKAVMIPEIAVDFGAYVFSSCEQKFGPTQKAIDCYNKGEKGASSVSEYTENVMANYRKIGGIGFNDFDDMAINDAKITQRMSIFASLSFIAVENEDVLVGIGMDTVKKIPQEKQKDYIDLVNRYMAQKTFILSAYKKAADIEKTIYHLRDYGGSVSAGGGIISGGGK